MKITLLHNRECGAYIEAIKTLERALIHEDILPLFIIRMVRNDEEAKKYSFFGSPTIQIEGKDIYTDSASSLEYHVSGSRTYPWEGKEYSYPSEGMVRAALQAAKK